MKKIGELPAITDVPAGSLLIVNTENGTKKITYEDLCQAVKATLGIPTVVQSIDITELGNILGGTPGKDQDRGFFRIAYRGL